MKLRDFGTRLAARLLPEVRNAFRDQSAIEHARRALDQAAIEERQRESRIRESYMETLGELAEAATMAGSGPWKVSPGVIESTRAIFRKGMETLKHPDGVVVGIRESVDPAWASGVYGDIDLMLSNLEWRREINLSWLEFSRWGIQQIILISRLYFVKNPLIQRGIKIASAYVFGRGVEVSSDDESANQVLTDFFARNNKTFGRIALMKKDQQLYYDGQVFFVLFPDAIKTGEVLARTFDATEIQEIITDPEDTDVPWLYKRIWTTRRDQGISTGPADGVHKAYYPALGYTKENPPAGIQGDTYCGESIMWDAQVYHMRGGIGVSKWHFDVPKVFAALPWAKAATRWLEWCSTVKQALAQIAMTFTTKGGQQAIEGAKQQLQTSVSSMPGTTGIWDSNPPAVMGSTFISGSGTELKAFNTKGAGGDPSEVREYRNMVAIVLDIPPTFLGDLETANLATATTLDRPTEISFEQQQELWHDCLITIATFVLQTSMGASGGRLRESLAKRKDKIVSIRENRRVARPDGKLVYVNESAVTEALKVKVVFPEILQGDVPQLVESIIKSMTLGTSDGIVRGIDERTGVGLLYETLGVENVEELLEAQYPTETYDPEREEEELQPVAAPGAPTAKEAARRFLRALKESA